MLYVVENLALDVDFVVLRAEKAIRRTGSYRIAPFLYSAYHLIMKIMKIRIFTINNKGTFRRWFSGFPLLFLSERAKKPGEQLLPVPAGIMIILLCSVNRFYDCRKTANILSERIRLADGATILLFRRTAEDILSQSSKGDAP